MYDTHYMQLYVIQNVHIWMWWRVHNAGNVKSNTIKYEDDEWYRMRQYAEMEEYGYLGVRPRTVRRRASQDWVQERPLQPLDSSVPRSISASRY
jgi:hypothetical protein